MSISRIWILYKPKLYTDLFKRIIQAITTYEIVDPSISIERTGREMPGAGRRVDIVLLPLDDSGRPDMELLPVSAPNAKLIAFSPTGDLGMRRLPGEHHWEEVRPFGLGQLLLELNTEAAVSAA